MCLTIECSFFNGEIISIQSALYLRIIGFRNVREYFREVASSKISYSCIPIKGWHYQMK